MQKNVFFAQEAGANPEQPRYGMNLKPDTARVYNTLPSRAGSAPFAQPSPFSGLFFVMEALIKYAISFETLSEGLLQRTSVRLRSPFRTGFFGSDAFSQRFCELVKVSMI